MIKNRFISYFNRKITTTMGVVVVDQLPPPWLVGWGLIRRHLVDLEFK